MRNSNSVNASPDKLGGRGKGRIRKRRLDAAFFRFADERIQAAIDCLIRFMAEFSSCRMRSAETL